MATEKALKELALQERLGKRAALVCVVLRKFIANFYTGRQQMLDEARAKELAKLAGKGKKGKRKKKADPRDEPKPPPGAKDKKPKKSPVQEAWQTFLADMDERINKQKRVGLEDMYRGVAELEPQERVDLAALLATTDKKILPLALLNINQHNVRMALVAASAAHSESNAVPANSCPGLRVLRWSGASSEQVLEQGFNVSDALRAGYSVDELIEAEKFNLKSLREAGLGLQSILDAPGSSELRQMVQEGPRGLQFLREAGYGASELVACGGCLADPWSLAQAGYSMMELYNVGITPAALRAAGFGEPGRQPVLGPVGMSMQGLISADITSTVAPPLIGTQELHLRVHLKNQAPQQNRGPHLQQAKLGGYEQQQQQQQPQTVQDLKRELSQSYSMTVGVLSKA